MNRLRLGNAAALVAGIVSLSGSVGAVAATSGVNWTQAGFNAQHTNANLFETTLSRSNVSHLVPAFDTPIGTGPDPVVANGAVYLAASPDGSVQSINAVTGSINWTGNACNTGEQTTAPAFAAAKVWVGLDDPGTAAISTAGSTVACLQSDLYTTPPSTYQGIVFAGGSDGVVVAINATTGTMLWKTCVHCGRSGGPPLATPAVSTDGHWLFIGSPGTGDVYKLNAQTGALVWTRFVDSCGESAVTVSGSSLLVSGCAVYALSAGNGAMLWHSNKIGSSISAPAVAGGLVFVDRPGHLPRHIRSQCLDRPHCVVTAGFTRAALCAEHRQRCCVRRLPGDQQSGHVQQQHGRADRQRGEPRRARVHGERGDRQWTGLHLHLQLRNSRRVCLGRIGAVIAFSESRASPRRWIASPGLVTRSMRGSTATTNQVAFPLSARSSHPMVLDESVVP